MRAVVSPFHSRVSDSITSSTSEWLPFSSDDSWDGCSDWCANSCLRPSVEHVQQVLISKLIQNKQLNKQVHLYHWTQALWYRMIMKTKAQKNTNSITTGLCPQLLVTMFGI